MKLRFHTDAGHSLETLWAEVRQALPDWTESDHEPGAAFSGRLKFRVCTSAYRPVILTTRFAPKGSGLPALTVRHATVAAALAWLAEYNPHPKGA